MFTIILIGFLYFIIYGMLALKNNSLAIWICLLTAVFCLILYLSIFKFMPRDIGALIIVPVVITSFQNIFLGINIDLITASQIPYLVIINYLYGCIILLILLVRNSKRLNIIQIRIGVVLLVLVLFSLIIYFNKPSTMNAFFSSFRNLTCPIIYFWIGLLLAEKVDFHRMLNFLFLLTFLVFIFGIIERFLYQDFWIDLNIGELWSKKGIYYNHLTGKPYNHYSAERIAGQNILRMVSGFGEPVNLGTYFALMVYLSWWKRNKTIMFISLIGCILTVSKGALMSILVLGIVLAYYKFSRRSFYFIAGGFAILVVFVYSSINSAGGSMAVHINGLINAVTQIFQNPLGSGVGNVGVYGNLYAVSEMNQIQESGLGVVIGQLGIIGLFCYFIFFYVQYKIIHDNEEQIKRHDKILVYTLIFSYALLMFFSESALGPNASALYLAVTGIVCGKLHKTGKKNEK